MATKDEIKEKHHSCPYCDEETIKAAFPFCQACSVTTFRCPECRKPVAGESRSCPHCGARISK
jgi:endogenous inhibitor of DNA gyrase (YacG/DUF329 family)